MKWTVRWKIEMRNPEGEIELEQDGQAFDIVAKTLRIARRKALLRVHSLIEEKKKELADRGSIVPKVVELIRGDGQRFDYVYEP